MRMFATIPLVILGAFSRVIMSGLPNVEPIMLVTIVSGVKYGWKHGLITGFFSMMISELLIYGTIPYFALGIPLGLIALTSLMTNAMYGTVGLISGFFKKYTKRIELTGLAIGLTLVYDLVTNIGFALIFNMPIIQALLQGIPFMLMHILGNAIIVGICAPYLLKIINIVETKSETFEPNAIIWKFN